MEMTTVHDERELRRKRREAKIEADLLSDKIEAEKKRIDTEKKEMEARIQAQKQAEELEEEEAIKNLKQNNVENQYKQKKGNSRLKRHFWKQKN